MDDRKTIILDISSDDEVGWGESGVNCDGGGCGGGGGRDDGDWISELLDEVEKKMDDSDEVMVVGEVVVHPKQRVAKSFAKCVDDDDDDDDDCVVLDGDPDKPVAFENDGGEDTDDLCIVSEKGQVACRDYPHPRHLCVKFPFNSTPHERHCGQCHCYVCDSVAPCVYWGSGVSSVGHCHATEKDEIWKSLRRGSKISDKAPPLVSGVELTPMNQFPSSPNNPLMHNQELPARQPCSITSIGTPNIVMPVRTQEARYDIRNKFQPHLNSHHLGRHNVGHAGTQFIHRVPFKRPGVVGGVLTTNRYGNNSFRNNYGYQFSGNRSPVSRGQDPRAQANAMLSTYQGNPQANFGGIAAHSVSNSPIRPNMGNALGNDAASQAQISSQIRSSSINANSAVPHPQLSSQTCMGSNSANLMLTVPRVANQQSWGSPFRNPLQPQEVSQLNVGKTCQNVVPSRPLVTSHGNIDYSTESVSFRQNTNRSLENPSSYQPQPFGQPPPVTTDVQNGYRRGNQAQSALHSCSSNVEFNQDSSMNQNSQSLPVECPQLQSAILRDKPASAINSQLPPSSNSDPVDFQFNTWSLEDKSPLENLDIPLSPGFNLFSPESAPIDTGLLFDFEMFADVARAG